VRMHPFWKLDDEDGLFELRGFAALHTFDNRQRTTRRVIYIFDGLEGQLTEARLSTDIHRHFSEATREEVELVAPEALAKWDALPEEEL
jgi:hypothetical protein